MLWNTIWRRFDRLADRITLTHVHAHKHAHTHTETHQQVPINRVIEITLPDQARRIQHEHEEKG